MHGCAESDLELESSTLIVTGLSEPKPLHKHGDGAIIVEKNRAHLSRFFAANVIF
jgi:hypothetical protein